MNRWDGFVTRTWEKIAESRKSGEESGKKGRGEAIGGDSGRV